MSDIAKVRMYKGEDICCECGRHIRNIVEIDGVAYGVRCCEKYLPRTHRIRKGEIVEVKSAKDIAREIFADDEVFPRFWIKPVDELVEFLAKRDATHWRYAGVSAILAARRATEVVAA